VLNPPRNGLQTVRRGVQPFQGPSRGDDAELPRSNKHRVGYVGAVTTPKTAETREVSDAGAGAKSARDVIVLPEAAEQRRVTIVATLGEEFAEVVPSDVVERVTAAARHALERSGMPATPEAVEKLARERLRAKAAAAGARRIS